jgi:hypothetical protein
MPVMASTSNVLEMQVQRPLGDLRPLGDVVHAHFMVRAFRKELDRRLNDPLRLRGICRSHKSPRSEGRLPVSSDPWPSSIARSVTG